ncbi:MAG TPA: 50S ribosomal protein L3 [Desulfobacterales bacterium]|nr:50S ribosomal protein L3 [Desulfobacterales bacterium]
MCKGLMGKKLGMTGLFASDGRMVPVTVIQAGPCVVTQIKTQATDGYNALQLGFDEVKPRLVTKPRQGHFRKSGELCFRHVQEFPVDRPEDYTVGQQVTLEIFAVGERVDVSGTTKGRGFAGVIKKEGFSGGRTTHGSKCHRIPGSIGSSAWPSRVFKGKGMPGHYGVEHQTMQNMEIIDIRPEDHLLLVRGAVPGPATGLVAIKKPKIVKKK